MKNQAFSSFIFISGRTNAYSLLFFILFLALPLSAQISTGELTGADQNVINTAVPFLTISADARASGMGDAGAATIPDVNSQQWNSAKYAFSSAKSGVAISYTPWARVILPGLSLSSLTGYTKLNDQSAFSASFRYFSLGSIAYYSTSGTPITSFGPHEFALDAGYSHKLSDHFSGGIVARYIHSALQPDLASSGGPAAAIGKSFAADIGFYYENYFNLYQKPAVWALGMNISNVGSMISYTDEDIRVPLPANLRIGGRITLPFAESHLLSLHLDVNKLLAPTSPIISADTIQYGYPMPESSVQAIVRSFYDAPGYLLDDGSRSVFLEEMHEIILNPGLEYTFMDKYILRGGCFLEHSTKGNRKYASVGFGTHFHFLHIDFSYLLPFESNSLLAKTFSIKLSALFGQAGKRSE